VLLVCSSTSVTLPISFNLFHTLSFCYEIVTNFWGSPFNCGDIITVQEKIVKIVAGARTRASYVSLFQKLEILLVTCQYRPLLSLMNLVDSNQENVQSCLYTVLVHGIFTKL